MPERSRLWISGLCAALLACGSAEAPTLSGDATAQPAASLEESAPEEIPGLWRRLRPARVELGLTPEQREEIARLEAIGYVSGSQQAPTRSGVTVYDRDRVVDGLNFYTSGHAPEALLIDMEGRVLHRWRVDFLEIWPDYPSEWLHAGAEYFRRAWLFENGEMLAIFEGIGIIRIDRDSNLLWAQPNKAHHDLQVMPNGDIYVLTRKGRIIERLDPTKPVLEDFVTILGPDGQEKQRVSLLEALERSTFRELWDSSQIDRFGDIFHTNTIEVLDGRLANDLPAFRRGNVLISMLKPDLIAVVDLDAEAVVWAYKGSFKKQHDPRILDNGNLLLFDNRGPKPPHSRVIEFAPATPDETVWSYTGADERPFGSFSCGTADRLAGGNTLITESDRGRAFEVTPEGEIVWEFYTPYRANDDRELIATLFEMVRLPIDFGKDWVGKPE